MHLLAFRPEELLHHCPYFALWSLDTVISMTSPNPLLDILVHERSLSRGVPLSHPLPEQFFHPSSYNFGRYFTAFDSDKLKVRSNAIYWFSCSLFVTQNPSETKKPQTLTSSTLDYVVLTRCLMLWHIPDSLLRFGFWCFCNVACEVVMVIKWNDVELKLRAEHLASTRDKISTRSNYFQKKKFGSDLTKKMGTQLQLSRYCYLQNVNWS